MWGIFPYYLYLLINQRWIISAILLAIIASTHNLAFIMSIFATIPYVVSLALQRTERLMINLIKSGITFAILAAPALILFYIPVVTMVLEGNAAESAYVPWPSDMLAVQLTPGLLYAGIIGILLALWLNMRILGWLSGWALMYFAVFSLSSLLGERFGREISVVFGLLVGISVAYVVFMSVLTGRQWVKQGKVQLNRLFITSGKLVLIICILISTIVISYSFSQHRFYAESDPLIVKYFTNAIDESNNYFLTLVSENRPTNSTKDVKVVALFGDNPWLKVTTYGKFEILSVLPSDIPHLSKADKLMNDELAQIITYPDGEITSCVLKKYGIDYVYISDMISGRWYSPYTDEAYYEQLNQFQSVHHSSLFDLENEFFGTNGEHLRIFSVNNDILNQACNGRYFWGT